MSFKDQLKIDLDDVFLNMDEFAEEVNIDGTTTRVVIDEDELKEYKIKSADFFHSDRDGLSKVEVLFFVWQDELQEKPFKSKHMKFRDRSYRIYDVALDNGLYTILLEGYMT